MGRTSPTTPPYTVHVGEGVREKLEEWVALTNASVEATYTVTTNYQDLAKARDKAMLEQKELLRVLVNVLLHSHIEDDDVYLRVPGLDLGARMIEFDRADLNGGVMIEQVVRAGQQSHHWSSHT